MISAFDRLSWLTSHPVFRERPLGVAAKVLKWEWHRKRGKPVELPLNGLRVKARPSDGMGRLLCYFGEQADDLFAFIVRFLRPGMTYVDVGANIGAHAILGATCVSDTGRVLAFEADPQTHTLLLENLSANNIRNTQAYQQCLSDRPSLVQFNVNRDSAKSSIVNAGTSALLLQADTLDNLLPSGAGVDLLKIDVEGADYLVLQGAKGIFERAPPSVVVVETTANASEITGFLSQHGYDCCEYDGVQSLSRLTHPVQNTYAIHASARRSLGEFRLLN